MKQIFRNKTKWHFVRSTFALLLALMSFLTVWHSANAQNVSGYGYTSYTSVNAGTWTYGTISNPFTVTYSGGTWTTKTVTTYAPVSTPTTLSNYAQPGTMLELGAFINGGTPPSALYTFASPLPAGTVMFIQDIDALEVFEIQFLDASGAVLDPGSIGTYNLSNPARSTVAVSSTKLTITATDNVNYGESLSDFVISSSLVKQVRITQIASRDDLAASGTAEFYFAAAPTFNLSGSVLNDANGLTDNTVNGTGVNGPSVSGTPLYVSLVSGGVVIATVPVTATGAYSFTNVANGNYSVVLTTNSSGSTTPSLPASWTSTGENLGTAAGNDGSVNGILTGITVAGVSVTNANLAIEQPPVVTGGTNPTQVNPLGTATVPVSSTLFTGTDPEDGTYPNNLTGRTVTFTSATNGTLYYNGTPITTTTVIPNFDPTKVTLDPTATGATTGAGGTDPDPTFTYTVTDNAGVVSSPQTITVPFTAPLPVSLVSFTAKVQEGQTVLLEWTTSWERSNKGYTLERSKDLISFEQVGHVSDVAGTSQSISRYRFVDATPYSGTSYYRLSQTDLDGTTKIFPAVSVVLRNGAYGVFPNPVRDGQFTLSLDEPLTAQINLYTADGRPVGLLKTGHTDSNLQLKTTQTLPTGVYLLTVQERGQTRQYRILVN